MKKIEFAGWSRQGTGQAAWSTVDDAEVEAAFKKVDKDKSGAINKKVIDELFHSALFD